MRSGTFVFPVLLCISLIVPVIMSAKRILIALDFDHTVVDDNTDTVVRSLLSKEQIKKLNREAEWTDYMQEVFDQLYTLNITKDDILSAIEGIPETPGYVELIRELGSRKDVDVIIISDSNSVFIDTWLTKNQLSSSVRKIFTNPAQFQTRNYLKIRPYHIQKECRLSSINLCKGKILTEFLQQNPDIGHCIYAGDGRNDICPILRLTAQDLACPRKGYSCEKELKGPYASKLKAPLFIWESGKDLHKKMSELIGEWTSE